MNAPAETRPPCFLCGEPVNRFSLHTTALQHQRHAVALCKRELASHQGWWTARLAEDQRMLNFMEGNADLLEERDAAARGLTEASKCGIHGDSTALGRCASCDAEAVTRG